MKTLVLANQKGGVGKSAVATLLAHYLRRCGKRVLAIDLDHQGNFTSPMALSKRAMVTAVTSERVLTVRGTDVPDSPFVLVPAGGDLLGLERQPEQHNPFARNMRAFLKAMDDRFDVCVIDTHPSPDIRLISVLCSADFVLSPIQLNQESIDGVRALLVDPMCGVYKIKKLLNPKLNLIGLLPTMVEATPFQRDNLRALLDRYLHLMIRIGPDPHTLAKVPKRSAIAEAQAEGLVLWEMKKTAAREAWAQIEPTFQHLAKVVTAPEAAVAL
jgi:chromosome partitioning protein